VNVSNPSIRKLLVFLVLLLVLVSGVACLIVAEAFHPPQPWKWLLDAIGGFLAISVAASFVYSATLRRLDDAQRADELRGILDEQVDRLRYGLGEFSKEMNYSQLFDDLRSGDELWWLDTYAPGHKVWINHLRDAVSRGAKIRMLVIDPTSRSTLLRAIEIGELYDEARFQADINTFINDLSKYVGRRGDGLLELRKYSDLPCIPMYLVRRNGRPAYGYTSFFLTEPTGVEFPHIRWQAGQRSLLDDFFTYIEKKWKRNNKNKIARQERQ
jgi:hypothetical protein